jgi:hypothetical protein
MKKVFLTIALCSVFVISKAYKLLVHKSGSVDGYYNYVIHTGNPNIDLHILSCTDPGSNRCTLTGGNSTCVSDNQANDLIELATAKAVGGEYSGSLTTNDGTKVSWSAGEANMEIEITKDCD